MECILKNIKLIALNKGSYEGKDYYKGAILYRGSALPVKCTKEFYDKFKSKLDEKEVLSFEQVSCQLIYFDEVLKIRLV